MHILVLHKNVQITIKISFVIDNIINMSFKYH